MLGTFAAASMSFGPLLILIAQAATASSASSSAGRIPSPSLSSPLAFVSLSKRSSSHQHISAEKSVPFFHPSYYDHQSHNQKHSKLYSATDGSKQQHQQQPEPSTVIERLDLTQQFERWKFLQQLLEAELPASDIEDVLLLTFRAYLLHGPTGMSSNNKNENGGNASPVLTPEQKELMGGSIGDMECASDGIGDSRFLHLLVLPPVDYESTDIDVDFDENNETPSPEKVEVDSNALSILEQMEQLLPDPDEDEEAFKSAWDVVIDLYGRESVRVREEALQREKERRTVEVVAGFEDGSNGAAVAENLQWRTLCAAGRLLIHYDFLTKGVLKEGAFRE